MNSILKVLNKATGTLQEAGNGICANEKLYCGTLKGKEVIFLGGVLIGCCLAQSIVYVVAAFFETLAGLHALWAHNEGDNSSKHHFLQAGKNAGLAFGNTVVTLLVITVFLTVGLYQAYHWDTKKNPEGEGTPPNPV